MNPKPQVMVTLSADLWKQLRRQAREEQVSLRWLVAGLICDTVDSGYRLREDHRPALNGS